MNVVVFRKPLVYGLLCAVLLILVGRYLHHSKLFILAVTSFSEYYAMDENLRDTPSEETEQAELNLANTDLRNHTQVVSLFAKQNHGTGKPILILFTTWDSSTGNDTVRRNVLKSWSWLKPAVTPVLLTSDPDAKTEALLYGWHCHNITERSCSKNPTPTMRSMFHTITELYGKKVPLLAFATGDTLFNEGIVSTFKAFLRDKHHIFEKPFVVLGKRTDVLLKSEVELESNLDVQQWSRKGKFEKDGLSGFIVTNLMFPWNRVPNVNWALQGVYEWIAMYCRHKFIPVYDITATAISVHILTKPTEAQQYLAACNQDIINMSGPLPPNNHCGHVECFTLRSMSTTGGHITFHNMDSSELPVSCNDCLM